MRFLLAWLGCFCAAFPALAETFYVSGAGDDANPGTISQPWRTVQKAANTLAPGDVVLVRGGIYEEAVTVKVSGGPGAPVTFASYPGETAVLDGTNLTVPKDADAALFLVIDHSHVVLRGFELRNYKSTVPTRTPAGVFIGGACSGIEIRDCLIHDIWKTGGTESNPGSAFGVAVYGSGETPSSGIVIDGNEIHSCKTGWSETLVLNGNVTNFAVTNNRIHDCNNIGIDFIGFEGTGPAGQDQARDGVCRGNEVWNITSEGNPAYASGDYSAGAIYVDGGTRITIERNIARDSDIGIELASEHTGKLTSGILLRDNFIYRNRQTGLFLGGYASGGTGGTDDCSIIGNTFWNNDTLQWDNGEAQLRFRTSNCRFERNIFVTGAGNWLVTVPVTAVHNTGNTFDRNLYFSAAAGGARWKWNKTTLTGFAAWQGGGSRDTNGLFADPLFVSTTGTIDLHLQRGSPAVDAGGTGAPVEERDIDGAARQTGTAIDIGADELTPWEAWRRDRFGPVADDTTAGPLADPDGNGLTNLEQYVFGIDGAENWSRLPTAATVQAGGEDFLAFEFCRALGAADVTCEILLGDLPAAAAPGPRYGSAGDVIDTAFGTQVSRKAGPTAGLETIVVRDKTPLAEAAARFIRLRLTLDGN